MAMAEKDKELIRGSWESLGKNKIPHGVIMFNRMFELEPSLRDLFNFNTTCVEDYLSNAAFLDHVTRVMLVLDAAVNNLDNLLALEDYLVKLGRKHAAAGVSTKSFGVVGESLLYMLQCSLGEAYSAPVQQAWLNLYTIVEAVMSQGWTTNSEHKAD